MARCPTLTICWAVMILAATVLLTVGGCITPVQVSSVEDSARPEAHPDGLVPITVGAEPVTNVTGLDDSLPRPGKEHLTIPPLRPDVDNPAESPPCQRANGQPAPPPAARVAAVPIERSILRSPPGPSTPPRVAQVVPVPAAPMPLVEIETIGPPAVATPPAVAAPPAPIEPLPPQRPVVSSPPPLPTSVPDSAVQIADGQLSTRPRTKSIQQISLNIEAPALRDDSGGRMAGPLNYAAQTLPLMAQQQPFTRGELIDYGLEWHPAPVGLEFCYQPLYFEEVNVERYGRSLGLFQPLASAASFYGRIPLLPYMVFARPARRCTYHPHWTLPGYRIPGREPHDIILSPYGAGAEIAVAYGLILLIP